ncbi:MAG: transporter substrate-binding domain-containing protein [Rhodospirillaceae bacterium]
MSKEILAELTDPTTLRVGVNMGNMLLVTDKKDDGTPVGVSPDFSKAIAGKLGIKVAYKCFPMPGEVADALADDAWDICLIAAEPARAETISFCKHYTEIEATYIVPNDSPFQKPEDVDRDGVKIAVANRAAYDLFLTRSLKHATLERATGLVGAVELYKSGGFDALAGLVPAFKKNIEELPGHRILPGRFTAVTQSVGTKPANKNLKKFCEDFIAESVANGFVQSLIDKHGVTGKLMVAT